VVEGASATDTTGTHDKKNRTPEGCQKWEGQSSGIPPGCGFFYGIFPVVSLAKPRSTTG